MRSCAAVIAGVLWATGSVAIAGGSEAAEPLAGLSLAPGTIVRITTPKLIAVPGVLTASPGRIEWAAKASPTGQQRGVLGARVEGWSEPLMVPEPGETMRARLVAMDSAGLLVIPDGRRDPVRIPTQAVARLEVRSGSASRGKHALIGGAVGAGLGLALWGAGAATCRGEPECMFPVPALVLFFPGLGTAGGAIVGALIPPGDRWQAPHPSNALSRAGRRGMGVRVLVLLLGGSRLCTPLTHS